MKVEKFESKEVVWRKMNSKYHGEGGREMMMLLAVVSVLTLFLMAFCVFEGKDVMESTVSSTFLLTPSVISLAV